MFLPLGKTPSVRNLCDRTQQEAERMPTPVSHIFLAVKDYPLVKSYAPVKFMLAGAAAATTGVPCFPCKKTPREKTIPREELSREIYSCGSVSHLRCPTFFFPQETLS